MGRQVINEAIESFWQLLDKPKNSNIPSQVSEIRKLALNKIMIVYMMFTSFPFLSLLDHILKQNISPPTVD